MNDEAIIRREARKFYNIAIDIFKPDDAINCFRKLKVRLLDFYAPQSKAVFLDEVEDNVKAKLVFHRERLQGEKSDGYRRTETKAENLLFYLRQEIGTLPVIAHQKFGEDAAKKRAKVFVSYSEEDRAYLEEIQKWFKPFLGQIDYWDASKIQPGQNWKDEIQQAIKETKVAILLVSIDFLGSEFINTSELPPLIEAAEQEGAVLLMIVLRPCFWEDIPTLAKFQTMNPPDRPVSKMDDNEREELFVNLVRQTKRILSE